MKRVAVYPGSFDPITNGHLNIIERAANQYDELVVAVVVNPNKNSMFSLDDRINMIKDATSEFSNVRTDSFEGLLAEYVNNNKYSAVIRGLRNEIDFAYEEQMANINSKMYNHGADTVFFITAPEFSDISSSAVREIASLGGDISRMVPENVYNVIKHMEE